tara:strand:- start:13 stop:318 length:306 start_codon:yes stop_codon:yes gene_type:complete
LVLVVQECQMLREIMALILFFLRSPQMAVVEEAAMRMEVMVDQVVAAVTEAVVVRLQRVKVMLAVLEPLLLAEEAEVALEQPVLIILVGLVVMAVMVFQVR